MFKRRDKRPVVRRLGDLVWPGIGWRRWWSYFRHRVGRMSGSPHSIAGGFAFGAAVSFTPFLGFHIVISAVLSILCRMSALAAVLGTVVGNPWTFPFIWAAVYALGVWITGMEPVSFEASSLSAEYLAEHFWDVMVPMTVGGIPAAAAAWLVFYFPVRGAVARYHAARAARRTAKREGEA